MTLLEIMFTVGIIAIIATIGTFEYVASYRQSVMKNTVDDLTSLLRLAQQKAVAQETGAAWGVYVDNTGATVPYADMYSGDSYSSSAVFEHYQIPNQVYLQTPAAGTVFDIHFQRFSGIPTASGTLVLGIRSSGQTKTITVTSQGGISSN